MAIEAPLELVLRGMPCMDDREDSLLRRYELSRTGELPFGLRGGN